MYYCDVRKNHWMLGRNGIKTVCDKDIGLLADVGRSIDPEAVVEVYLNEITGWLWLRVGDRACGFGMFHNDFEKCKHEFNVFNTKHIKMLENFRRVG